MKDLWHKFGWIISTVLGSAVFALGFAMFLGPNDMSAGGISGCAPRRRKPPRQIEA